MKKLKSTRAWVFTVYFMQGLPASAVWFLQSTYFVSLGMSLKNFGLTSIFSFAWSLKFLWSPLVDIIKTRRFWLIMMEVLILGVSLLLSINTYFGEHQVYNAVILFGLMAIFSATHDIAIDGYYLEQLTKEQQQFYSGFRVMAYRIAMLFVSAVLVWIGGKFGWRMAFSTNTLVIALFLLYHYFILPPSPKKEEISKLKDKKLSSRLSFSKFTESFLSYLHQDKIVLILIFLMIYKVGDQMMFKMATPFLMRELHVTISQMAIVSGTFGKIFTILGAILGGIAVAKLGLKKGLIILTIIQGGANIFYIMLAYFKPGLPWIIAVHSFETFAGSLSSVALINYLMFTCKKEFKASHYAIASGLITLGGNFAAMLSGFLVESFGYVDFFTLSFLATLPGMIILFFLPYTRKEELSNAN